MRMREAEFAWLPGIYNVWLEQYDTGSGIWAIKQAKDKNERTSCKILNKKNGNISHKSRVVRAKKKEAFTIPRVLHQECFGNEGKKSNNMKKKKKRWKKAKRIKWKKKSKQMRNEVLLVLFKLIITTHILHSFWQISVFHQFICNELCCSLSPLRPFVDECFR